MLLYTADHSEKKLIPRVDGHGKRKVASKKSDKYYPFGLLTSNSWTRDTATGNQFLYNDASELNTTSGLYDLPFRNYDAALGRFFQVDPLAHRDASTSPFAYAGNNPISYNDPWGLLKATQQEFFDFINDALNGNGGTWSEDGGQHLFSDGEFAAMNASFGEGGSGSGSFLSANGDGTGTGLNWSTGGGMFSLTVSTGPINKYGGIWEGPNSTMNTVSIDIPDGSLRETADAFRSSANDVSAAGLEFIAQHEGYSSTVYNDVAGLPTIGYGHLIKKGEIYTTITKTQALQLLKQDASFAVNAVNNKVTTSLTQNQFDALTSFIFNVGTGAFSSSSLLRNINAGNNSLIGNSFGLWNKAMVDGVLTPVDGLTTRRADESDLYLNGNY